MVPSSPLDRHARGVPAPRQPPCIPPSPQVTAILRRLAAEGALLDEHLGLLWSVTEQDGAHENVKTHVYDCLAELVPELEAQQARGEAARGAAAGAPVPLPAASTLAVLLPAAPSRHPARASLRLPCPPQVDFLFAKMSAERERTELDTIKLLELLVKIAGADEQVRGWPRVGWVERVRARAGCGVACVGL